LTAKLKGNISMNRIQSPVQFTRLLAGMSLLVTTLLTSFLTSSTQMAQAGSCRTVAKDWDGYVDVRSAPKVRFNNLITMLPNSTELEVIGQQGDWLEIYAPEPGWVAENQTRRICSRDGKRRRTNRDYNYQDYDGYRD
jgi:hypothetical protein